MLTDDVPTIKSSTAGRLVALSGDLNRFLVTGDDTDGRYAQWEAILPPGGGPPVHVHSREEEALYVLAGEVTARVGDHRLTLTQGMSARLPIGLAHGFRNESGQEARILFTAVPAGLERFFFEAGSAVTWGAPVSAVVNAEERDRVIRKAAQYGIRFLGMTA